MLSAARRPFAIVGGSRWSEQAVADFRSVAEAWALPVGCTFRRQMLFDHLHPNYAGDIGLGANPALSAAIRDADLVLLVGARFGEVPSADYTLLKSPYPAQALVHVHPDAGELGRVYRPTVAINASPGAFAEAFARRKPAQGAGLGGRNGKAARILSRLVDAAADRSRCRSRWGRSWTGSKRCCPQDAILCNGAGNYATWIHRYHRFRRFGTQAAPTSGSMGYGTPAAVAAKELYPDRLVVAFAGDGCFLMNGQEFATAVQYGLPIIVIVVNNGIYGTIRMHQEREFPGRVIATDLQNPDFAALARAYGGHGETVERTADFAAAFERARASGKPSIIEVRLDPEAITPTRSLTDIRERR